MHTVGTVQYTTVVYVILVYDIYEYVILVFLIYYTNVANFVILRDIIIISIFNSLPYV